MLSQYPNNPHKFDATYQTGNCYFILKDFKNALSSYKSAQQIIRHEQLDDSLKIRTSFQIARTLSNLAQYNNAIKEFESIYNNYQSSKFSDDAAFEVASLNLRQLNKPENSIVLYQNLIKKPHGIILITGPTGSGKSTTLYASLLLKTSADINVTTIEDPVEYHIDGVTQVQVDMAQKVSFSNILRHILRQDPDVIMIGEIRDKETADIALRAALTGHLVFSTLHTNDAVSALTRLIEMGCEPYLVSSCVVGILAQRLVRKNCEHCKEAVKATEEELRLFGVSKAASDYEFYRGKGCSKCKQLRYSGRTGIFELLEVDSEVQRSLINNVPVETIKNKLISKGMRTLLVDGFEKVKKGIITSEEVFRVAGFAE